MAKFHLGKTLAFVLRHKPESVGVVLDENGWADIDAVVAGISKIHPINKDMLLEAVRLDDKGRYAISEGGKRIRARQGHSIKVNSEMELRQPPMLLYHGTAKKFADSILERGLLSMSRLFVHLSWDEETALSVGKRHGEPIVFTVDAGRMARDGYEFYLSENGVWNTATVPKEYLHLSDGSP